MAVVFSLGTLEVVRSIEEEKNTRDKKRKKKQMHLKKR